MDIQLDFRSGEPIYLQIVDGIRQSIAQGSLKPGDQLPTVRQLATELRINFNTVARAYRLLDEAGLISTQQGRGTYIWEPPTGEIMQRLRLQSLDGMTRRFLSAAARQGFTPEEVLAMLDSQMEGWRAGVLPADPGEE